jgi:rubredoxin
VITTTLQLESVLTCPECGHAKPEVMPTDACQFFYDCTGCGALLRPRAGEAEHGGRAGLPVAWYKAPWTVPEGRRTRIGAAG